MATVRQHECSGWSVRLSRSFDHIVECEEGLSYGVLSGGIIDG